MTNNNKEKLTTSKTIKTILFAGLFAAMIFSVSATELTFADKNVEKKGKLFIKEKSEKSQYHDEMNSLYKKAESTSSSEKEKDDAKKRIDEIKEKTKIKKQIPKEKQEKIREHIDTLGPMMIELEKSKKIPMISVGTDFENESLKIKLLKDDLTNEKILKYEKEIRKIVGDEIDITITSGSKAVFTSCSQTGDCNPIKGGVKIVVDSTPCSMGFKASYNQKTGFVTAGHCNSGDIGGSGENVGNPTGSNSDKLGYVYANAFGNNSWCDCLFVSASETISDRIYSNVNPSSTLYPVEDDWIVWKGYSSGIGVAQIEDTYIHFTAELIGVGDFTILGAVEIKDRFQHGDSGGSVYENGGSNRFAGIISANEEDNNTTAYYIPYYRITSAFPGLTFTYS